MRTRFALLLARLASFASRLLGRGSGSALPGLIVEKIDPRFLQRTLEKLPQGVVLITGTNGKTTTTKMVVELLEQHGLKVLTNKSGSNFTRGILSMLVRHSNASGDLPYDIAILELDEAYARLIARDVPPKLVVALNVHRDQLDRYGELNTTAQMIGDAMKHARYAIVNGDDPILVKVAKNTSGPTIGYFGAADDILEHMPTDDQLHGGEHTHKRPPLLVELTEATEQRVAMRINDVKLTSEFKLPGIYNAVNAAAAVMTVVEIMPSQGHQSIVSGLARLHPAFGRGETFSVDGKQVVFGLVKNPSGFNHNLRTMLTAADVVLIAINDQYADGRDVSWLWDVHVGRHTESFATKTVHVAGVRADDMLLRLDQDGISGQKSPESFAKALDEALLATPEGGKLVIFPTYTAMLALRQALSSKTEVADIW